MIKEQAYSEKFTLLEPWVDQIFSAIKKEIRNEHMRREPLFVNKHFSKKTIDKITNEEIKSVYLKEILSGNEELGEWIASRWMLRHAEIYQFFALELSRINPNFEQITEIPEPQALLLMHASLCQHGAIVTYIFSLLNAVAFPVSVFETLRTRALEEVVQEEPVLEVKTLEEIKEKYEALIVKLNDRFEKKIAGMQRKYSDDIEGFKKQIKTLQRRLQDAG